MTDPVDPRPRSTWSVGELRHGILNLADAFAQWQAAGLSQAY